MTVGAMGFVRGFDELACRDPREVGGKAAGLAGLTSAGLPVPPGFVIGAAAYRAFRRSSRIPLGVAAAIRARYRRLCVSTGTVDLPVAVRSSATAEDSAEASFAGEFETWVDVTGADAIIEHVVRCWESVFSPRAVSYAESNGIDLATVEMAVVVQKMVRARAAGVMFTISPVTGDRSRIAIEASWGLGLAVVGGEVTPDRWVVDKVSLSIVDRTSGDKRVEYRGAAPVAVDPDRWSTPCLTDDQVLELARLGKQIERTENYPQDVEFALDGENIVLLQRRPETVWSARPKETRFSAEQGVTQWITGAVTPQRDAA